MAITFREIPDEQIDSADKTANRQLDDPYLLDYKKLKDFSTQKDSFFQIDKNSLALNTSINFNLYRQKWGRFEIILKADNRSFCSLDEETLSAISNDTASEFVIEASDIPLYQQYLNSNAQYSNLPENEKIQRKTIAIKENSKVLMKELLDNPRSGEKIKEVKNTINIIANALLENNDMIYTMLTLNKYDAYTYTHCVNVGTLSLGLGIATGLTKEELENLGVGAMLHDIGKTEIPSEILNKQGKLNDFEYRWIQEHVKEGERILQENRAIPVEAYDAVIQHHEKLSGKGYPYKLMGYEIGLFGRICAIADCYDALTTQRPYKSAFRSFEALKIISKESTDYDAELLAAFVKMLGKVKQ